MDYAIKGKELTITNDNGVALIVEFDFNIERHVEDCFLSFEGLYARDQKPHEAALTTNQAQADALLASEGFNFTIDDLLDDALQFVDIYEAYEEHMRGSREWAMERD